jgi:uncharacterized OB-fold protein
MARYIAHQCPRCGGFISVKIIEPQKTTLQAVNSYCYRCRHRSAWIVIRGKHVVKTWSFEDRLREL